MCFYCSEAETRADGPLSGCEVAHSPCALHGCYTQRRAGNGQSQS